MPTSELHKYFVEIEEQLAGSATDIEIAHAVTSIMPSEDPGTIVADVVLEVSSQSSPIDFMKFINVDVLESYGTNKC